MQTRTERALVCSGQGNIIVSMLYGRYAHLTKAYHIHETQTHPLVREELCQSKVTLNSHFELLSWCLEAEHVRYLPL